MRDSFYKIESMYFDSRAPWAPKLPEIVTAMPFWLVFGYVCVMECWIVVSWGKMIQPRKTSPEVVRRFWDNFWGQTHLIRRGIHSQNMFSISCLDVFENSNFDFFLNSLCRSRLNLNPWISPLDTQDNFPLSPDMYLWGFFYQKLLAVLRKKCLKISCARDKKLFIPWYF